MMHRDDDSSASREGRLDQIIAEYFEAKESGKAGTPQDWITRYPELAAGLREFFANEEHLRVAAELDETAQERDARPDVASDDSREADVVPLSLVTRPAGRRPIVPKTMLNGRFEVVDVLAGGMGHVFLARILGYESSGMIAAIKTVPDFEDWRRAGGIIRPERARTLYGMLRTRFRREAEMWIRLTLHLNVIWAWGMFDEGDKPFLVMEYADGGHLGEWISDGRIDVPMAVNLGIQFCDGMCHAVSEAGIVHRDIKPANVLLTSEGTLKITDFGLAKAFDVAAEESGPHGSPSRDSEVSLAAAGTVAYMAPEQLVSISQADTRSDVYSFGVVLYEMLTGSRLFQAGTWAEHRQLRRQPAPPMHRQGAEMPPALSGIVRRCLACEPDDRYASFDALRRDLLAIHHALQRPVPLPVEHRKGPAREDRFITESSGHIALQEFSKALATAEAGLAEFPARPELWVNKGKALHELGDDQGAFDTLQLAVEHFPDNAEVWANLGWARVSLGDAAAAFEAAIRATELAPDYHVGWMCRGYCENSLGRMQDAVQSLERCTRLAPHDWRGHYNLGVVLFQADRCGDAVDALEEATRIAPQQPDVWSYLALAQGKLGLVAEAGRSAAAAVACDPNDSFAWTVRGVIAWEGRHDGAEARRCFNKALELNPHNEQAAAALLMLPDFG